jgi:diguanylate cyclase (GGDEF)-like protein
MGFAQQLSPFVTWAIAIVLSVGVLLIEFYTPGDFATSVVFLAPIIWVTWVTGRAQGIVVACVLTVGWGILKDFGGEYSSFLLLTWAVVGHLIFYLLAVQVVHLGQLLNEKTRILAHSDTLTGLANTRELDSRGRLAIAQSKRDGTPLTLAFIDVDYFKSVNDTVGHARGDKVLQELALTLQECVRETDVLARIGGDEFIVLLPATGTEPARTVLQRMAARVAERNPHELGLTLTVGAVSYASPPDDFEQALHEADELMYQGKKQGRNRVLIAARD